MIFFHKESTQTPTPCKPMPKQISCKSKLCIVNKPFACTYIVYRLEVTSNVFDKCNDGKEVTTFAEKKVNFVKIFKIVFVMLWSLRYEIKH